MTSRSPMMFVHMALRTPSQKCSGPSTGGSEGRAPVPPTSAPPRPSPSHPKKAHITSSPHKSAPSRSLAGLPLQPHLPGHGDFCLSRLSFLAPITLGSTGTQGPHVPFAVVQVLPEKRAVSVSSSCLTLCGRPSWLSPWPPKEFKCKIKEQ